MAKRKNNTHKNHHARVKKSSRADAYIIGVLLLALLILVFILCRSLINPDIFLIQHIEVQGKHPHLDEAKLRATLKPYLHASFFSIDLSQLREQLLDFPWIAEVKMTRVWPHELVLQISEQVPVAIWNDKELMNEQGDVFAPSRASFPANLPALFGSPGQQLAALDAYRKISEMLKSWHLAPSMLMITPQQSIMLVLTNGMQVKLGNDNIDTHFRHFLQVYNDLFLNKEDKVEYIDISYPNGLAVKWKS
jgi:cell division protein FtsQ